MSNKIGLVVVHGIGSQKPGETIQKFIDGLHGAFPTSVFTTEKGNTINVDEIANKKELTIHMKEGDWQVNIYEAYWANILSGEDVVESFGKSFLSEATWFPKFNFQRNLWPPKSYSKIHIAKLTTFMVIIEILAFYIFELFNGLRWFRVNVLDNQIGDVWNYVHSFKPRMLKEGSPIKGKGQEIIDIVTQAVAKAHADGCTEIHLVAHSLGSVITHNALTQLNEESKAEKATPINYLYTIGSPLEKFRYFWPIMMRNKLSTAQIIHQGNVVAYANELKWYNFHSSADPVSGKLVSYDQWGKVKNLSVPGLGSSIGAHISYRLNPLFINTVAGNLGREPDEVRRSWLLQKWINIKSFAIDCSLPILIIVLFFVSLILTAAMMWCLGWVAGALLYSLAGWWFYNPAIELLFDAAPSFQQYTMAFAWWCAVLSPIVIILIPRDGYRIAKRRHSWFNDYELEKD